MTKFYKDDYADSLNNTDYEFVSEKQYVSLNGLLKPFKGKEEYEALLSEI